MNADDSYEVVRDLDKGTITVFGSMPVIDAIALMEAWSSQGYNEWMPGQGLGDCITVRKKDEPRNNHSAHPD
jgi:hypothetical protein